MSQCMADFHLCTLFGNFRPDFVSVWDCLLRYFLRNNSADLVKTPRGLSNGHLLFNGVEAISEGSSTLITYFLRVDWEDTSSNFG